MPALLRDARPRPDLLRLLLRLALASKPPTGFMRDIVVEHSGEHAGHFDIKHGGLLPIVNIARYAGLAAGATTTSTVERLRAAAADGQLDAERRGDARGGASSCSPSCGSTIRSLSSRPASAPDDLIDPKTLNTAHAPLPAGRLQGRRVGAEVADDEARVEHLSAAAEASTARTRDCRPPRRRPGRLARASLRARPRDHRARPPRRRDRRLRDDADRRRPRPGRGCAQPPRPPAPDAGARDHPHPRAAQGGPRRRPAAERGARRAAGRARRPGARRPRRRARGAVPAPGAARGRDPASATR